MPGRRRGRWRRRCPRVTGRRCALQQSVARATAPATSSQVSERRPARASERAQHLPPRPDQVEVGGVPGPERHLPARVRQHGRRRVGGAVAAQVVGDGVDALGLLRQPALGLLREGRPVGGAAARAGPREGGARRGTGGAEDAALAAPAVVDLPPRATCRRRSRPDRLPPRMALGAERSHLVEADHHAASRRGGAERLDAALSPADPGSTRPPDQASRRRRRRPSASGASSIRLRRMAMPLRSSG